MKIKILLFILLILPLIFNGNPIEPPMKLKTQSASISGTVYDMNSGESLAGVKINIVGSDTFLYSDLDGKFTIQDIEPGSYDIILSLISYDNSLVENIILENAKEEKLVIKLDNK